MRVFGSVTYFPEFGLFSAVFGIFNRTPPPLPPHPQEWIVIDVRFSS